MKQTYYQESIGYKFRPVYWVLMFLLAGFSGFAVGAMLALLRIREALGR